MGIQILRGQEIDGFSALTIRNLLRSIADASVRKEWLRDKGFSEQEASHLVVILLQNQYIELDPSVPSYMDPGPYYKLTEVGQSMARATGAKLVRRKTAEQTLSAFMARVRAVNESSHFLVRVTEVVLFGSYLTDKEMLGDLDIACKYENKFAHLDRKAFSQKLHDHFRASGRCTKGLAYLFWPWEEVRLYLKSRKRTISLHEVHEVEEMIQQSENFVFEVMVGDREAIVARSRLK